MIMFVNGVLVTLIKEHELGCHAFAYCGAVFEESLFMTSEGMFTQVTDLSDVKVYAGL
jgi:hypothetical protein